MNALYEARAERLGLEPRTGAVLSETKDSVTISRAQRQVHVTFEALAVVVAAPFMFYLATRKELPDWARVMSGTIGVATVVVDGGLLYQYVKKRKADR